MSRKIELHAINATALAAVNFVLKQLKLGNFITEAKFTESGWGIDESGSVLDAVRCTERGVQGRTDLGKRFLAKCSIGYRFGPSDKQIDDFSLLSVVWVGVQHGKSRWGYRLIYTGLKGFTIDQTWTPAESFWIPLLGVVVHHQN